MKYNVFYKPENVLNEEDVYYGEFEATSEFDAIEQVIAQDRTRNILSIENNLELRHWRMFAELIDKPSALKMMSTMEEDILETQASFIKLEQLYEENLVELQALKASSGFGATFHYHNTNDKFIPVFALPENLEINYEKPYSFTLNFDQKILAQWLVECEISLNKEEE